MLKIKFNINKFTIIFLRRFEGKNECKKISFSLYQLQRPISTSAPLFLFSFGAFISASMSLFFFFSWSALFSLFVLFSSTSLFFFFVFLVQPLFLFFSVHVLPFFSAQKLFFFSAQNLFQFSATLSFSLSLSLFFFQRFLFFLFFSSVYPRPNILSSCFTSLLFELIFIFFKS